MRRRGRPPHPDILTPREWEVLEFLRAGLSNPEIAERLGVSRDAVKYHVSEILSKLGVPDREEAAAWQERPRPWSTAVRGLLSWPASHLALIAKGAAIGTVGAAAAGIGILAYGVIRTSGDTPEEDLAAGNTPPADSGLPPGATPPPSPRYGAEIPLPRGVALIVATGCADCPTDAIVHTYRAPDGSIRTDTLISAGSSFLPRRLVEIDGTTHEADPYLTYATASDDASIIVAGVCTKGECSGDGAPTPDAEVTLYQSTDVGATWSQVVKMGPREFVAGILPLKPSAVSAGNRILIAHRAGGGAPGADGVRWLPEGEEVLLPEGANPQWVPMVLGDGSVAWQTDDGRLLDGAGSTIASVPGATSVLWRSAPPGLNPELIAIWPDGQFTYGTSGFTRSGEQVLRLTGAGVMMPDAWAGDWLAFGHMDQLRSPIEGVPAPAPLPSLIDLRSGLVCDIVEPFSSPPFAGARNQILAVQANPSVVMTCEPAPIPSPSFPTSEIDFEELRAVLASLPKLPGVDVLYIGQSGLDAEFRTIDSPDQVIDLYARELPALGWQAEGEPQPFERPAKDDSPSAAGLFWSFVREDARLEIRVLADPEKDPSRPTSVSLTVLPAAASGKPPITPQPPTSP